ncbi:hypothetical protein Taro_013685 [Colocasia esculenta]|uniref:Uncharacterized protein n=1 Tax=Colocasia esculenta TaxID=4460 RepID=A0A843UH76_COLES|nr:hypothetical protein [Colocasia esculenta]
MYFDTEIRTRRTQSPRNDNGGDPNVSNQLSIFKCPGRAFEYSSTRALEDRELVAVEIYIFMNCAELDPYIEEFHSVILQWNPRLTDVQVEKECEKSFATWLRYREKVDPNALDDHVVEWEVESDEEEEWTDDEDEEDDEDDAELHISSASDDEYR